MIEQSIAHYRITDKIGQGGMGEVYRATDTKLNRDVALKLLPDLFSKDPDRMARFSREAQVLASLNHPNIAAIHGLEEAGGKRALVMELVEGETLQERLQRGPMPLEEALTVAKQIAEALEEAHEHGFIHRDLKPANVKITPKGTVKVLDFGLAKALEGEAGRGSSPDLSQSPTLSAAATAAGVIMGTAAYMSPEQARGQAVDRRADIWSFGVVLYEMLSGKSAFGGDTVSDVLASVLKTDIDLKSLPSDVPTAIRQLLRRCLTRDRKQRLQSIGDARITIQECLENPDVTAAVEPAPRPVTATTPLWRRVLPWAVAGILAATLAATPWMFRQEAPFPMRVEVKVSPGNLSTELGAGAVMSPDGQRLAYVVGAVAEQLLYVRSLDQLEGTALAGTEGAYNPFFSPDGRWIAFVTPTHLKKVAVTGGAPLTLCEVNRSRGGSWGSDDTIVFASSPTSGLFGVSAAGGTPEELTHLDEAKSEVTHRWPQVLPGGNAVLFTSHTVSSGFDNANIEVLVLSTGERKVLYQGGSYARYAASGHLVFARQGTLFAAPFDLGGLEMTSSPAPIIEGVTSNTESDGGAQFDFSDDGTIIYLSGAVGGPRYSLVWVDREGNTKSMFEDQLEFDTPRFSPDGNQLAVDAGSGPRSDVWIYDLRRGVSTRLTFGEGADFGPFWSPDSEYVGFSSDRAGIAVDLYWTRADGSGEAERLTESPNFKSGNSLTPDGAFLVFHEQRPQTAYDIMVLPFQGDRKLEAFLSTPFTEAEPEFSPDGRWIAYMSNESGSFEVYVRPFPQRAGKWQISTGGGIYPRWSRDGRELFYRTERGLMAVSLEATGGTFRADTPRQLFEGNFVYLGSSGDYDVHPDGRFVMLQSEELEDMTEHSHLTMVTNWFEELRRTFAGTAD
ncbi:MAG: protein kinase domain-containing protein [Vicinamibacteria bacterium]